MNFGIIYTSATGNTKLLADAIAIKMGCPAIDVHTLSDAQKVTFWQDHPFDFIFIGTGIYSGHVGVELRDFLINYPPPTGTKAAIFGTWMGWMDTGPKSFIRLMNFLEKKEINVIEETYLAFGKMGVLKLGHPNSQEIEQAVEWAVRISK